MNIFVLINKTFGSYGGICIEIEGYAKTEEEAERWVSIQRNTDTDWHEYEEVEEY